MLKGKVTQSLVCKTEDRLWWGGLWCACNPVGSPFCPSRDPLLWAPQDPGTLEVGLGTIAWLCCTSICLA